MDHITCLNPQVIVNPSAATIITRCGEYYLNGKQYFVPRTKALYPLYNLSIRPKLPEVLDDNVINNTYALDRRTGEIYPLLLKVPCNHCELCDNKARNAFVHRCELETQCYDCPPWFLTLTYDDWHKNFDGVNVRDVQLFMKRLRRNLASQGYTRKIRYCICAEYGTKTHRPHYHAIIWNLAVSDVRSYDDIVDILQKSWKNGFITHRQVDPSRSDAFRYTAKYLKKDCIVPDGCQQPFMLTSRRNGGIGAPYLEQHKSELQKTKTNAKWLNKWNGQTKPVQWSRYVINRVYPPYTLIVPSELRTALTKFYLKYYALCSEQPELKWLYEQKKEEYDSIYCDSNINPCYGFDGAVVNVPMLKRSIEDNITIEECIRTVDRYKSKKIDFRKAEEAQKCRDLFIAKLAQCSQSNGIADLEFRASTVRRSRELAIQREVL